MNIMTYCVACAAMLAASATLAGMTTPVPVTIVVDGNSVTVTGDLATARYSKHAEVFIGCGVRTDVTSDSTFSFGFCQAQDASGTLAFCQTSHESLLETMRAMGDFSFITFSYEQDAECSRVGFSNQSFYLPRGLKSNE